MGTIFVRGELAFRRKKNNPVRLTGRSPQVTNYIGQGCISVGRATDRHAAETGMIPRCSKGFFFQDQLSVQTLLPCVRTPPYAVACTNVRAHVKDPVVHVRVRWIIDTVKHPVCCRRWLYAGKASRISRGRNPNGKIQSLKKNQWGGPDLTSAVGKTLNQ